MAGARDLPLEDRLQIGRHASTTPPSSADLVAAADLLAVEPVGVTGFCMGGMFTLKAAATGRFHRAVAFYGMIRVPEHWQSATPGRAARRASGRRARPARPWRSSARPTSGRHRPTSRRLEAAGVTVVRYEGADHGFVHDDSRPAHRPPTRPTRGQAIAFLAGD